jgi:A/G-specific adenine glycosylase
VGEIPFKAKAAPVTTRYFHYLVARYSSKGVQNYFLKRREGRDIWQGLYEFPLIETVKPVSASRLVLSEEWERLFKGTRAVIESRGKAVMHQISHRIINTRFYEVEIRKPLKGEFLMVPERDLVKYPLPRLIERFFFTTGTRGHR